MTVYLHICLTED